MAPFVPLLNFWNQAFAERARMAATGCVTDCVGRIQEWDAIIYNGNVEYRPTDKTLIYGRISTGYRAGGLPSQTAGIFPPIEEETVVNYEGGLKGLFFEDRLLLQAGAYYNAYDGFQISAIMDAAEAGFPQAIGEFSSSPLVSFTTNVDGTVIYGADFEWTYFLNDSTRLSGYYAFLDSKLGEFATVVQDDPDPAVGMWTYIDWETGANVTGPYIKPRNLKDGKLPQQAKHKAAVTVSHDLALTGVEGSVQLLGTWSYTGDRFALVQNAESNKMPAYDRLDLRAAWTSANEQWSATLYVQNALDEIGFAEYVPGVPARLGFQRPRRLRPGLVDGATAGRVAGALASTTVGDALVASLLDDLPGVRVPARAMARLRAQLRPLPLPRHSRFIA